MRKVEVVIDIDVKPEKVISAFTDSDMLRDWWRVERVLIEKRIGGVYMLAWSITDKGFGYVSSGIVSKYEPDRILEIEKFTYLNPERSILGPMKLTVDVKEKNGKSEMYLSQSEYQQGGDWDWYYNAVNTSWPSVARILKDYLEKK